METQDIAEKLVDGVMAEDAILLDAERLEQAVDEVKAEGYQASETIKWDRLVTEALTTGRLFTVAHLKALHPRLAEHYLEIDMDALKAITKKASRQFASVGEWIFAKSGGECGRVTEVISTGSPHYEEVRKEYLNRYGLDQVSIYENATAVYRVVHADNSEELYYDTETSLEPSQANVSAVKDTEPAKVDPAVLKQAVSLWWSLLPASDRQGIFARSGASLKVLDAVQARLARSTEADIEEYHPLLATAYRHILANPVKKLAESNKKADEIKEFPCESCNGKGVSLAGKPCWHCDGKGKIVMRIKTLSSQKKEADGEPMMAIYSVGKMVTAWDSENGADPNNIRDFGYVDQGNIEVSSPEELPQIVQDKLGLQYPFELVPDDDPDGVEWRWDTNQVEDDGGMADESGKWLCDYSLYAKFYSTVKPTKPVSKGV